MLTALQSPVRADLSRVLQGFGTALNHTPTAAEDVGQLPEVHGISGGEALNGALKYGGDAGRYSSQVTNAFLGGYAEPATRHAMLSAGSAATPEARLRGLIAIVVASPEFQKR